MISQDASFTDRITIACPPRVADDRRVKVTHKDKIVNVLVGRLLPGGLGSARESYQQSVGMFIDLIALKVLEERLTDLDGKSLWVEIASF
jgi:hypothetical protein